MIPIRSNGMTGFPKVSEKVHTNWFPLDKATICIDASDYKVVNIATQMLADDLERIMTIRPAIALATSLKKLPHGATIIAGTLGHSRMIDELVRRQIVTPNGHFGQGQNGQNQFGNSSVILNII